MLVAICQRRRIVPGRLRDFGAEPDVATQIVAVGDEAEIAQDFRLGGVFLRPGPGLIELGIEGVAVVDGLDVAAGAGIAIPVPGAADVGALFERNRREARLAQPMQQVKSGEAGADHRNVDLLRGSALRGV
ncbi:hypothetical protein J2R87_001546 [Bradyrhizobium elkanii]|nr:hypothetical protein [Bradyrhizobium elkanii]MCS4110692.1 hypothetical protein [Bradyrhizobium elkanii]